MEDPSHSKRRRGVGIVTANACTECRKKRAKCDGAFPCARCKTQSSQCRYETPVRHSKDDMRAEIDQLRRQHHQSDRIITALMSDDVSEEILLRLRNGDTVENISDNLEAGKDGNLLDDNFNVTSYRRPGDQQAIQDVVHQAASLNKSSFSATASSETKSGSLEEKTSNGIIWSPTSAAMTDSPPQLSDGTQGNRKVDCSPTSQHSSQPGRIYPLIGIPREQSSNEDTIRWAREQGRGYILGTEFGVETKKDEISTIITEPWTQVTSDSELTEHLMALYFCWEYPTFASLSKEHFLEDFRAGRRRYCSSLLVNAILAIGCRFSNQAAARSNPKDSATAGDHFFAEAVRLLEIEKDSHSMTTIQALGLMSIREASGGRSSGSIYYAGQSVMIAVEMGLHLERESGDGVDVTLEQVVKSATFWGAYSLDQAWSLAIGRLPHFSRDTKVVAKPAIIDHVERSAWVPYTDDGDTTSQLPQYRALTADPGAPLERNCTQPSNVRSVFRTFCELSELVHKTLYMFYTPGTQLSGQSLLDIYTEYLSWYDAIPEALRLGHNFTPAVLFVHMYYHFAILLLFRPFIKLNIIGSGVSPDVVCNQAADAIAALVKSYSQLYTLSRTPSFVPYVILTSSITHLVTLGLYHGGPKHLQDGISSLKAMENCHGFARRARDILTFLADDWGVQMTLAEEECNPKIDSTTLGKPRSISSNLFAPNFNLKDVMSNISSDQNDRTSLFWPFPMQGRPLLGEVERAGFQMLTTGRAHDVKMEGV